MSDKIQNQTTPRKLPLVVMRRSGEHSRQAAIRTAEDPSIEHWDAEYVCLSGFAGPHGFEVFAAAPDLLEALRECRDWMSLLRGGHPNLVRKADAAIAKAEGQR